MNWDTFWPTYLFLFLVVMLRANATYWVARGISVGARRWGRSRGHRGERWHKAQELVRRWGAGAVVVCFLTVGIQTAVNATAGAVRMPLRRYLPAVALGGALWALVYATVGLAAVHAWLIAAVQWPGTIPVTAVVVAAVATGLIWRHRRSTAKDEPPPVAGIDAVTRPGADDVPLGSDTAPAAPVTTVR